MSATEAGARFLLLSGKPQIKNLPEILRLRATSTQTAFARRPRDDEPAAVRAKLRRGDLVAHVERVGLGDLTVCAFGYPGDLNDPDIGQRVQARFGQLTFKCEPIGPEVAVVVVTVPPQLRFD